jgi:hypothetical protein
MHQAVSGFLLMYSKITPTCFGKGCHLPGVVGALQATQVMSMFWACTNRNPYTPTIHTLSIHKPKHGVNVEYINENPLAP